MAPFSSTSAAPSTPASTSPVIRPPTRTACAATSPSSCATSRSRWSAIPAATSSRPTTGKTASARATSARPASTSPGTRPRATPSASTNSPHWCETVGTEMMLAVNLGSRGLDEARNFVEYVNGPRGTLLGRPAQERQRRAVRRRHVVPRQRDGRPLAGRPQDRRRVRPPRQRDRQDDARLRQDRSNSSSAARRTRTCRPIPTGSATCSSTPTTRRPHLAAHVLRQPRRHTADYLGQLDEKLDATSARSPTPSTSCKAKKRIEADVYISLRRVERLVPFQRCRQARTGCTGAGRMRRVCSKTSTTSRTCCRSAASSTPSSAARTW